MSRSVQGHSPPPPPPPPFFLLLSFLLLLLLLFFFYFFFFSFTVANQFGEAFCTCTIMAELHTFFPSVYHTEVKHTETIIIFCSGFFFFFFSFPFFLFFFPSLLQAITDLYAGTHTHKYPPPPPHSTLLLLSLPLRLKFLSIGLHLLKRIVASSELGHFMRLFLPWTYIHIYIYTCR